MAVTRRQGAFAALTMLLLSPKAALACAVCFGEGNTDWTSAFLSGTLIMLALPVLIVGGFGVAIYRATKRAQRLEVAISTSSAIDGESAPPTAGLGLQAAPLR